MKKNNYFVLLFFLFLLIIPSVFSQENITITTYYPAPFGVYEELRSRRMAIGQTYFDQSQHPWAATAIPAAGEISQDADLVVEGNVGIGTTAPDVKLLVNGTGGEDSMIKAALNNQDYGARMWVRPDGSGRFGLSDTTSTADAIFFDGSGQLASYFNAGDVGIGTTTPQSPAPNGLNGNLDVNDIYLRSKNKWISNLQFTTTIVSCSATYVGSANTYGCTANCPAGYQMMGGGHYWGGVNSSWGRYSMPSGNGWMCGINIQSCSAYPPSCQSSCYAVCGKIE